MPIWHENMSKVMGFFLEKMNFFKNSTSLAMLNRH